MFTAVTCPSFVHFLLDDTLPPGAAVSQEYSVDLLFSIFGSNCYPASPDSAAFYYVSQYSASARTTKPNKHSVS